MTFQCNSSEVTQINKPVYSKWQMTQKKHSRVLYGGANARRGVHNQELMDNMEAKEPTDEQRSKRLGPDRITVVLKWR